MALKIKPVFDITIEGISPQTFGKWLVYAVGDIFPRMFVIDDSTYVVNARINPNKSNPFLTVDIYFHSIFKDDNVILYWVEVRQIGSGVQAISFSFGDYELAEPIARYFIRNGKDLELERLGGYILRVYDKRAHSNKQFMNDAAEQVSVVNGEILELQPWEKIPDHLWDRKAIEMWCKGYNNHEIGRKVNVSPRVVTNRISELRRQYPDARIPFDVERRRIHDTG